VSAANGRTLVLVLGLNLGFLVAELAGGLLFGSLALLADAAHMTSDVAGLLIALVAQRLLVRPPSDRHTFGLLRSEVLAAQANGVLLVASAGWVLVEAVSRVGAPPEIEGGGVVAVALGGLAVNLASAWLLFGPRHHDLNMRGAYLHMLADAAGSVAAVMAGVAALLGVYWVDPAASALVGVVVLWSAVGLLRRATHILLEGAPAHLDRGEVIAALEAEPEVTGVHHLHLWHLTSQSVALSGHVVLGGERTLHEAQRISDRLRRTLVDRFGIDHATLELECHDCEAPVGPSPA
jgi:cobalt-zinc-cadmium efflux system protein